MTKIFITGATGYIGGDALYAIAKAHPEYEISTLVRNSEKGAKVAQNYPSIHLAYGDLSSADVISAEAAAADVVVHTADSSDNMPSAKAIITGLKQRVEQGKSAFYVHVSGTGILTFKDAANKTVGVEDDKEYDDWEGVGEVTSLPDEALHRDVDKTVLGSGLKTAIVCPPTIYGPGRGPDNQRSMQVYHLSQTVLERGKGLLLGEGKNRWTQVHVQDLSDLLLRLVEEAVKGGGSATWGSEGYYFAEAKGFVWGDVQKQVAKEAQKQGLIESDDVESVTLDQAEAIRKGSSYSWGSNSRGKAIRAKELLGWNPTRRSLEEEIPDIVRGEALALGLVKTHAEKVAGQ